MKTTGLVRRESGYARKALLRDSQNLFFTAGLPLLYLLIFASMFGDEVVRIPGQPGEMNIATVMTASVIVIGVVSAAFQNLAITHKLLAALAAKIRDRLGWEPAVTFEEGIEKTVRWYLDHPEWLANVLDGSYRAYYEALYGDR